MLEAIRGAQKTITFETYIYWSGEIGEAVHRRACRARARRRQGARAVRRASAAGKIDESLIEQMEQAGVEVRRYNPLRWHSSRA